MKNARANGTKLRMKIPYESSLDQYAPIFYEPPQPQMPLKPIPPPPMQFHSD